MQHDRNCDEEQISPHRARQAAAQAQAAAAAVVGIEDVFRDRFSPGRDFNQK
jgi:hypothetical protein